MIPNEGGRVAPRRVLRVSRLDQARAERHHRHQQEGRQRDGGADPRRRRGGPACPTPADPSPDAIEALVAERQPHLVEYAGWEAIDAHERERGEPHGRPRVKLRTWDELMALGRRT